MNIKKMMMISGGLFLFAIIMIFMSYINTNKENAAARELADNRFISQLLAEELKESSNNLTSAVRKFVVTGDEEYALEFMEIVEIRAGEKPRHDNHLVAPGETVALHTLMEEAGYSERELELLQLSALLSEKLVDIEVEAMNAVRGIFPDESGNYTILGDPDRERGLGLIFGQDYVAAVEEIMRPFEEFTHELNARFNNGYDIINASVINSERMMWIALILNIVLFLAIMVMMWSLIIGLHEARHTAEAASQTKSVFLASMSHEIRTPMNAILGITDILMQNQSLPSEIEAGLDRIYNSCDMLLGIINDILDFSKIEAGKLDIIPAKYSIASLINDSAQLNMMRINSKPIEFTLEADENIPSHLIGDELRIKQVLNNLLSNAFKYTESGNVTLSVVYESNHLIMSVRDTGSGMTREQLGKLFGEYSRFIDEHNRTVEGTGLGLAITHRLVELMNGEILVESEPDVGSLFTVKLFQEAIGNDVLGKESAENLRQFRMNFIKHRKRGHILRDPMPYGKVLIVDDVETNLYVASGLMKLYRLRIDTAMSGAEAIEKINSGNVYDIIFMDHMMPEMDGIETTGKLRELSYSEPIIALTANAVAGQADVFLNNGFDEFISKPIDVRQLNTILNRFVRDKQPPEVIEEARRQAQSTTENNDNNHNDKLLTESFVRDARKAVTAFNEINYESIDLHKFTTVAHGMKSALTNINEAKLSELAKDLEHAGRTSDIEFIKKLTPEFSQSLQVLLDKLEVTHDADSADTADLAGKLHEIAEACADFDRKGALTLINSITSCSGETREILEKIKEFITHSDFDEAESAIKNYLKSKSKFAGKSVSGLDINSGLDRYGGDEDVFIKVLRSYTGSISAIVSELTALESVTEENLKNYEIKVHGIKGANRDIFADEIGEAAEKLELAAKSADFEYISENNSPFLETMRAFITDLENLLALIDAENPKPAKSKPEQEVLLKLLEACKSFDIDNAEKAVEEIEKYNYEAPSDNELAEWLRENLDMMRFNEIVEKLSNIQ
ncbi:MAG: ATP-binding protein [Oscillospiraceae bacterium]|nr:ATP-binding protein [Oscillospiraceae bacterium]